jgi:DNA-binding NarL/FixJ family response regulator
MGPFGSALTARERDIVDLLVLGFTAREISAELNISFHTVRTHIRNVYDKSGVASRTELVRWQIGRRSDLEQGCDEKWNAT